MVSLHIRQQPLKTRVADLLDQTSASILSDRLLERLIAHGQAEADLIVSIGRVDAVDECVQVIFNFFRRLNDDSASRDDQFDLLL